MNKVYTVVMTDQTMPGGVWVFGVFRNRVKAEQEAHREEERQNGGDPHGPVGSNVVETPFDEED